MTIPPRVTEKKSKLANREGKKTTPNSCGLVHKQGGGGQPPVCKYINRCFILFKGEKGWMFFNIKIWISQLFWVFPLKIIANHSCPQLKKKKDRLFWNVFGSWFCFPPHELKIMVLDHSDSIHMHIKKFKNNFILVSANKGRGLHRSEGGRGGVWFGSDFVRGRNFRRTPVPAKQSQPRPRFCVVRIENKQDHHPSFYRRLFENTKSYE